MQTWYSVSDKCMMSPAFYIYKSVLFTRFFDLCVMIMRDWFKVWMICDSQTVSVQCYKSNDSVLKGETPLSKRKFWWLIKSYESNSLPKTPVGCGGGGACAGCEGDEVSGC